MEEQRHRTAKDKLFDEIKHRGRMKTSDVIAWGVDNFCNRAERNMRQLATEGKVRRMEPLDRLGLYGKIQENVWELVK